MTRRFVAVLGSVFALAVVVLLLLRGVVRRVEALYPDALPASPYLVPEHAGLLYLLLPLAVVAAALVILAPGAFLVLAHGAARDVPLLALKSVALALVIHPACFSALKLLRRPFGGPPTDGAYVATLVAAGAAAWCWLAWRQRRGLAPPPPAAPEDRRRLAWLAALPALIVVLLLPVLVWQDINPDGLEALTTGRSLGERMMPRLPPGTLAGLGLGMMTMAYPVHWFIACFGLVDAAARLPFVIYLPLLFAGVVALAEQGLERRLSAAQDAVVVLGLAVFTVTMVYSDTYHMYSADLASPANIDILVTGLMVATLVFLFSGETAWFLAAAVLTHLTRPTALPFLAFTLVAVAFAVRDGRRPLLIRIAAAMVLCLLLGVLFDRVLPLLTGLSFAHDAASIGSRIRYLRFDDFRRILFVVVPCGIVPALALPLWRRQDGVARTITLVSLAYFLFFYVLAFVALHHFAPVMVLPLVVFWRLVNGAAPRPWVTGAAAAAALVALWLSLPRSFAVDRSMRAIGRATVWNVGDYAGDYSAYREAFDHKALLDTLFPPFYANADPSRERLGQPWVQIRYSVRPAVPDERTNYLGQLLAAPVPEGFTLLTSDSLVGVYVRDTGQWRRDRGTPPRTDWRSPVYDIPQETLFYLWGVRAGRYSVDVKALALRVLGRPPTGSPGP